MAVRLSLMTKRSIAPFRATKSAPQVPLVEAKRQQQGFTLIEALMAIVVITITLVSITPPIFWATGTRIQNRKSEQALQLAQGEIERVRTLVEQNQYTAEQLPPVAGAEIRGTPVAAPSILKPDGGVVSSNPNCPANSGNGVTATVPQYILVDTDPNPLTTGDACKPEFLIQTFRSTGLNEDGNPPTEASEGTPASKPVGFVMGVRVYSIAAKQTLDRGGTLEAKQASLRATNGLGNQRTRPLAVLYSTIVQSTSSKNLDLYRQLCPTPDQGGC